MRDYLPSTLDRFLQFRKFQFLVLYWEIYTVFDQYTIFSSSYIGNIVDSRIQQQRTSRYSSEL